MQRENKSEIANLQVTGKVIFFVTNNINKFNEARSILARVDIAVGMLKLKPSEIQSDQLKEIARRSALDAFIRCGLPTIVEDAGLFIDKLKGFPGPYAAYVYSTIGNKGLLKLMEKVENRRAEFNSVIAYCDSNTGASKFFEGSVIGEITLEERQGKEKLGFGFDPIFKPAESRKTFAEMSVEEKNSFSHRANAVRKFADWYKRQR